MDPYGAHIATIGKAGSAMVLVNPPLERMSGTDAMFVNLERVGHPLHTLKVLVLDPRRLGRQLTLQDVAGFVDRHLCEYPRLRQRVTAVAPFTGRPFWTPDPAFSIADHLEERRLAPPGDRGALDRLCSELASRALDLDKPLWSLTLVSGLADGQQAVIARIHHAVGDGLSAVNTLLHLTASDPAPCEGPVEVRADDVSPGADVDKAMLRRHATADTLAQAVELPGLLRDTGQGLARNLRYRRSASALPRMGFHARRNFCTTPISAERVCATGSVPLPVVKEIGAATGTSVNGVLHGVLAGAMRRELERRGLAVSPPLIAEFGVAQDPASQHRWGNHITPTCVLLHTDEPDPLRRLALTADSNRESIALRHVVGVGLAPRWHVQLARLGPVFLDVAKHRIPSTAHVVTANVRGPASERWIGPVRVADWFSFAIVVPSVNLNVTVHSYAGRLNVGVMTAPEVTKRPEDFVLLLTDSFDELASAAGLRSSLLAGA